MIAGNCLCTPLPLQGSVEAVWAEVLPTVLHVWQQVVHNAHWDAQWLGLLARCVC